jgi:hypothetical protein
MSHFDKNETLRDGDEIFLQEGNKIRGENRDEENFLYLLQEETTTYNGPSFCFPKFEGRRALAAEVKVVATCPLFWTELTGWS